MFRFHTGSIKRYPSSLELDGGIRFDSILVRLKGTLHPPILSPFIPCFDSILVRLKVRCAGLRGCGGGCFDSILVRLKGGLRLVDNPCHTRFDSILVRLKGICYFVDNLWIVGFRFHTGSIKRKHGRATPPRRAEFRFHTGSIKSQNERMKQKSEPKFRFHTGSIKSCVRLSSLV